MTHSEEEINREAWRIQHDEEEARARKANGKAWTRPSVSEEFLNRPKDEWPILDDVALRGLAGDIVCTIAPHSEADPVAILIQTLAAAGSMIGRRCYHQVESDRHHANLFVALVGQSSKARKGTSWGRVCAVAKIADQQWADDRPKADCHPAKA
jgi:hypothetical protein